MYYVAGRPELTAAAVNISLGQNNLIKIFYNKANTPLITKIALMFLWNFWSKYIINGQSNLGNKLFFKLKLPKMSETKK